MRNCAVWDEICPGQGCQIVEQNKLIVTLIMPQSVYCSYKTRLDHKPLTLEPSSKNALITDTVVSTILCTSSDVTLYAGESMM